VPAPHPCAVNPFQDGTAEDPAAVRADLDAHINCVQRHICRPEEYCKKTMRPGGGTPAEFKCRFGFPCDRCDGTHLEFEELGNGKVRAKPATKRNDGNINSHCRIALLHWRANVDFQVILDWDQAVRYMVKGVMAGSDAAADDPASKLRSVYLKTVGERDVSAQETSRLMLRRIFASSSFPYVRLNVVPDAGRQVQLDGQRQQGAAVGKSLPDRYTAREGDAESYPELVQLSAFQFCQRFYVGKDGYLQKLPDDSKVVVIKLPAMSSTKGGSRYAAYC
ncbi:unnamed protein product, partial [Laminaria digitata]